MPCRYDLRLSSAQVDALPPDRGLETIVDDQMQYSQQECPVSDCALRTVIERDPVTDFGKLDGVNLVSISCENGACGEDLSDEPLDYPPSRAFMAAMAVLLMVQREKLLERYDLRNLLAPPAIDPTDRHNT